jgi:hypothetical protein
MGENVKGLLSHDDGRTLEIIRNAIAELGYTLVEPRVLKAVMYQVPQKRERLILVAIRNDIAPYVEFHWPAPYKRIMTLRDAFLKGKLYKKDVPASEGQTYPEKKRRVLSLVPEGGDWRDLPEDVAKEFMGASFYLGGGKTGMARRLSMDEPSLTLTCAPAQKQTERCHPTETRPLTVREYARIQTFPDEWLFSGTISDQYKQIGNAVPVNLSYAIGRSLMRLFNDIDARNHEESHFDEAYKVAKSMIPPQLFPIDLYSMREKYPEEIIHNRLCKAKASKDKNLDTSKNVLVSLVTTENVAPYLEQDARIYYTGKDFPSTVELNHLYYFMPYIKKKGIRDLYFIKVARIGSKHEVQAKADQNDLRLVFEIEFVKQIFPDYKPIELKIWHTFTDTTLCDIMSK